MQTREFGRTGRQVSEIGFGAWAIGADWGHVDPADATAALNAALDGGMTFIDTADVYGDGRSEQLVAEVLKQRGGTRPFVATKAGRRLPQQSVEGYTAENLSAWTDRSLENLGVDTLDLVQLHCPPTDLYYHPEVFERLDRLVEAGKIRNYGVSVERVEEALKAMDYPGVDERPDHLQHLPPAPDREVLPAGAGAEGRRHRARAARLRPALGQVQGRHGVRVQRSSQLQPQRRGLRRRRDLLGRRLREGARRGRGRSARWSAATPPWRSSRCAGS